MIRTLDPLNFPLSGARLIEASAGTGKTWTIAALYLRMVLGPVSGDSTVDVVRPLEPAEILVMTFTKAATRELSDRIRQRLVQAARYFTGDTAGLCDDPFLCALCDRYAQSGQGQAAAYRLQLAAQEMDSAAIHTMDSWCHRMLRENELADASVWDDTLVPNEKAIWTQAAHDYWRQQVYPLPESALVEVLALWSTVDKLATHAVQWRGRVGQSTAMAGDLAQAIEQQREQHHHTMRAMSAGWEQRGKAMLAWLDAQTSANNNPWDAKKLQKRHYTKWLQTLEAWAQDPTGAPLVLSEAALKRLRPSGMLDALKTPDARFDLPTFFAEFEQLSWEIENQTDWRLALQEHASAHTAMGVARLKKQAGLFGFDDLLSRLSWALSGANGVALCARIRQQFPVVMVDEFQDTSLAQLQLLERIYSLSDAKAHALLLIGDPKQSIYGFRGADIDSYLRARLATQGRHYALDTNFRATQALVNAVNHVFGKAENEREQGAFMLGANGAANNPLPFHPVKAKGTTARLQAAGQWVPPFEICVEPSVQSQASMRKQMAQVCAEKIVSWLNDPTSQWVDPGRPARALRAADIAVLVRTAKEAAAMRRALQQRGLASVYLSDRDSVFATPEARDMVIWLKAVASPRDAQRVRAAFATEWMAWSLAQCQQLLTHDEALDRRCEQLAALQKVWQTQGVLALIRHSLHRLDLPARWLQSPEGERRLTNTLHLAELLQIASAQHEGELALIRWLAQHNEAPMAEADDAVLRLESDAELVKIITIHKSKGLEFPVVCLPFACSFKKPEANLKFVEQRNGVGAPSLSFAPTPQDEEAANRRRLQEDIRLLYVALTRAQHAIWLGFSAVRVGNSPADVTQESGLGYVLQGDAPSKAIDWLAVLHQWTHERAEFVVTTAQTQVAVTALRRNTQPTPLASPLPYTATFDTDWGISSYSSLVKNALTSGLASSRELPKALVDDEAATVSLEASSTDTRPVWHRMARGPVVGTCLHEQLEYLAQQGFAVSPAHLVSRCERTAYLDSAQDLCDWLVAIAQTPLPPLGTSLHTLSIHRPEMEFWMPLAALPVEQVDVLCRRYLLAGQARPILPARQLKGLMMGFADLVFLHQGRYWVLDYKSNYLGADAQAYHLAALEQTILSHRYDVQAAIYQLALHRLLRLRLGAAYRPSEHFGGALVYFVRGLDAPTKGVVPMMASPDMLAAFDQLFFGDEAVR